MSLKHLDHQRSAGYPLDVCDVTATKRSIVRYLKRYEVDWKRETVTVHVYEMDGCRPPEEGHRLMTKGRVIRALTELQNEGVVVSYEGRRMHYGLTDCGRRLAEYEPGVQA